MKNLVKILFSIIFKIIILPLRVIPVQKGRIVFSGLTGGNSYEYTGNPKYLCEYIKENVPEKFKSIWLVHSPARYQEQYDDILFVRHYSLKSFYYLITTKVVVTNGSYAPWFPFRTSQKVINTWHGGGAYKKIESDNPADNKAAKKRVNAAASNVSLFVSSCNKATELLFKGAFGYDKEVLEVGMPRNDMLINGQVKASANKVRDQYQIAPEEKIVIYAPTYRTTIKSIILDGQQLKQIISRDGTPWRILLRTHRYQEAKTHIDIEGTAYTDVSDYPDMQELLGAADMVITDYSSLIWDYSFLERPCFLYVPDIKEYTNKTGFYVDIEQWPFKMATSNEELIKLIEEYDINENKQLIAKHHQMMGSCETGQACKKVTEWILQEYKK